MECDLATLTLPVFDGLEGISNKARKVIEQAHHKLTTMAAHDRKRPYEYGKWLARIRDTLIEEGSEDGWNEYCKIVEITGDRARTLLKIYETFEPYTDVLHMFSIGIQTDFSRSKPAQDFLPDAIEEARDGTEISRLWLEKKMGVKEIAPTTSRRPVSDDDDDDDEDEDEYFDEDEDEEDVSPIERRPEFVDRLMENTLAIGDIEASRKELVHILTDETQLLKKRLVNWCKLNKVHGGQWFVRCEHSLDAFLEALDMWMQQAVSREGE